MDIEEIREIIRRELPSILQEDMEIQRYVREIAQPYFAEKIETDSRFDLLLAELRWDREEQRRKWDEENERWREQNRKWDEQNRKWDEQNRKWYEYQEAQTRRWDEQNEKWREQNRKWDEYQEAQTRRWDEQNEKWKEQNRKWDEQNRKWDENQKRIDQNFRSMMQKHDGTIGALGARWGLNSEAAFRNGLKGILGDYFDVDVVNVVEFDDEGQVFGRPDQIELDLIIKNGLLIICELKSSVSKSDMYAFYRKTQFYQKRHKRQADRLLIISPMVDEGAKKVADELGIIVYSYATDVDADVFSP